MLIQALNGNNILIYFSYRLYFVQQLKIFVLIVLKHFMLTAPTNVKPILPNIRKIVEEICIEFASTASKSFELVNITQEQIHSNKKKLEKWEKILNNLEIAVKSNKKFTSCDSGETSS